METYNGHVRTPQDAIILFEACRIGLLPRVQRRLSEKERQQIKSGSVFVWDEREAGMRRWTDGKSWSASRVSGSFLTYREMEGKRGGSYPATTSAAKGARTNGRTPEGSVNGSGEEGEGPDGYRYKPDGLMKQSFSITTSSQQHLHLISYFSRSHTNNLQQPSQDPQLRHIRPPKGMYPETTVNETTTVPAVTRGPMPASPRPLYTPAPQQLGAQSPYSRPGPSPPVPMLFSAYPGPPTPPYGPTAYYVAGPPPHLAYQQAPIFYSPQHGYHHAQIAPVDHGRLPPHLAPAFPPGAHPAYQSHPVHHGHPLQPQYMAHPPPQRPAAVDPAMQQSPPNGQPHGPPAPARRNTQSPPAPPEQGPVLPALNGIGNQSTPPAQPTEINKSGSEPFNVPETNGTAPNRAPSPSQRAVPSIHTLLNNSVDGQNGETNGNRARTPARSGSRSPPSAHSAQSAQRTQEPGATYGGTADSRAISKLNSTFV